MMSLIILVIGLGFVAISKTPLSPIPKSILSRVKFPVYYPDANQLPKGFNLNKSSIQYINPGVVIYTINYGSNNGIVISEEAKPSSNVVTQYDSSYIPLHTTFPTPIGQAVLGAYNDGKNGLRSIVSLPINNGPWLIATAPGNLSKAKYEQVIESLLTN